MAYDEDLVTLNPQCLRYLMNSFLDNKAYISGKHNDTLMAIKRIQSNSIGVDWIKFIHYGVMLFNKNLVWQCFSWSVFNGLDLAPLFYL